MTGWQIGTMIAELTDLDEKFGSLLSKLAGWGDILTDQERRQMILNKAHELGATNVHSYADALKFLKDQTQKNIDAGTDWTQKLADAHREVRNLTEARKNEIAIAVEAGATTEQITNKYGLSATALGILTEQTDKAAAAQAKLNAERQKELDAAAARQAANEAGVALMERDARLMADRAKFDAEQLEIQNKRLAAGKGYVEQMGAIAKVNADAVAAEKALTAEQAALDVENQKLISSFTAMEAAHVNAGAAAQAGGAQTVAAYAGVQQQVEITSDGVRGWLELMRATNAANALLNQNSLFTTSSTLENQARLGTAFSPIPGFAGGIENFGGGLAKVHGGEVLANLPAGTSVYPRGSGLGTTISNVFNLVDSESNLARRVSELIMRQVRAGTQLGTA
jgi:hypothetical protein